MNYLLTIIFYNSVYKRKKEGVLSQVGITIERECMRNMMQAPHQLDKEVLSVIYMDLQTSTLELAFMVELGRSISYGIKAYLCTGR